MDAASRLRAYIEDRGMSVRQFEIACGFKNGWVGDLKSSVKLNSVSVIHRNFGDLNIEWWLTGDGEMIADRQGAPTPQEIIHATNGTIHGNINVNTIAQMNELINELRRDKDTLLQDRERLLAEKQEIWEMYKRLANGRQA